MTRRFRGHIYLSETPPLGIKTYIFYTKEEKTYNVNTSPSKLNNGCTFVNWGREFDIKYLFMPSVNFEETQ